MGLNLNQVPSGTSIFIDSNIFLYIFLKAPQMGEVLPEVHTEDR
jgi:hypothetical protein